VETFSRHRPLTLLAGVVLAQVLLLAFQIKRDRDVRLIRYWAVELMTPVQRGGTWTFSKVGGFWSGYVGLHDARLENQRLQAELNRLQLRNRELESDAAEAQRLQLLLNFRQEHVEAPMLAAQVIGASADGNSHILFINRGERDRIRRNMAVITPDGIVGKVVEVYPGTAQVLLINDRDSGVGALLADTRTHGVVKGTGDPDPRMDYVVNDEKVHAGETLLTSGEDRIFPKGLLIGVVSTEAPGNPFQTIRVKTAARLDRLEDVLILESQQELTPKDSEASSSIIPPAAPPNAQASVTSAARALPAKGNPPSSDTTAAAQPQASPSKPAAHH
jgi:rod shape-determining protein MreC